MKRVLLFLIVILLSACTVRVTKTNPQLTSIFRNANSGAISFTKEAKVCYEEGIFTTNNDFSIASIAKKSDIKEVISVDETGNPSKTGDFIINTNYCIIVKGN